MATETAAVPVNGTYTPNQGGSYNPEQSYNTHNNTNTPNYTAAQSSGQPSSGNAASEIPKDEVGWYFVEQYYTTLSRTPEKLFLFYNKRSQFVSGIEEEKVSVCIGQKAINERIKELDFQDCKVRITNVDSQGSDENIIIQVIGEISNKHAPHRKFVQTFVLAGQTNGYFVLNDIFRYILDEEPELENEEVQQEPVVLASGYDEPVPTTAETESDAAAETLSKEPDVEKLDKELEEAIASEKAEASTPAEVNGTPVPEAAEPEDEAPEATESSVASAEPAVEEPKEPEKVKEPEPTKVAVPTPKASPAPPAVPAPVPAPASTSASASAPAPTPKAAAPKTWASLAASANKIATPVVPAAAQASAPTQPKAAPAVQPPTPAPVTTATTTAAPPSQPAREPSPANSGSEGWQTAGHDHNKRQSRVQGQAASTENTATRAYIKNVFESVDGDALKKELAKYGEIAYFDISRQKNCAFVDFATLAGFQAAVNANPHTIGDNQIQVEERRIRVNSYAFQRGGMPRGRGDRPVGQGRGGFKQEGARGGFNPRGRGGASTPRGRGGSQAA